MTEVFPLLWIFDFSRLTSLEGDSGGSHATARAATFARAIGDFVDRHPTVKMLALSFLLLVGVALIADAFDQHLPRGYIYFAMGFSVFVEFLNLRAARRRKNN